VALVALAVLLGLTGSALARPNVVVVLTDDQRWDTLSTMPNVTNRLVRRGVDFRNAFASNPLCCPSRVSILTGRYAHSTGVLSNRPPHGGFVSFRDGVTIATRLRAAGYRTAYMGKYLAGDPHQLRSLPDDPAWNPTEQALGARLGRLCNPPPPGLSRSLLCTHRGGAGPDELVGSRGYDILCGRGGPDSLTPGAGPDWVYAGAGRDTVRARDGRRDHLDCGAGRDVAWVDALDLAGETCEIVRRA
jgi:hypothetical protein